MFERSYADSGICKRKSLPLGQTEMNGLSCQTPERQVIKLHSYLGNQAVGRLVKSNRLARKIHVKHNGNPLIPKVQCELRRQPPGRRAEPPVLSDAEIQEAIEYNNSRYNQAHTRIIQDIVGASQTGRFNEDTIQMIVEWQADFRMSDIDGKIGMRTLRPIVLEMMQGGYSRNEIIWMIVDGHNMPTTGLDSLRYDPALADGNASTSGPIPGNSTVRIGPNAFAQGYEGLVHTIRHELEHVQQRRGGMANQNLREFLAEGIEIMSVGMNWEGLAGFMDDAGRCLHFWDLLSAAEQRANWDRFNEIRDRVRSRFNRASAVDQGTHQVLMNDYNARNRP
jgi:hypothetical protein